jgi:glycosyltransferase involved in cell wall biosynthesis
MSKNHKIRVGIVTENHFPRLGGMEICTYFLARALNMLPDTFASVACSDMPEVPSHFPYPYKVCMAKSFSLLTQLLYRKNIKKMISREKINILHGMMLHGGGARAVEIGKELGIPTIVQSQGSDVHKVPEIGYGAPLNPGDLKRVKFSIKNSNKIIALSSLTRDMIIELGASLEKITIIPNGFPLEEIHFIRYKNLRIRYNLDLEDFVIISSGRNSPLKRMKLLFQAISLLKRETNGFKCICVGPRENLPAMTKNFDIEDVIILTGRIPPLTERKPYFPPYPDLINLYRTANLYISVSYVEAFNASGLEALACGTPVLVTKMQGIRDVIVEGETGFTLQEETPEDLAETLLNLIQKKDELESRREYIKKSVSHLTWDNIARQMREVYLSLLE